MTAKLRGLPQIQALLELAMAAGLVERHSRDAVVAALRAELARLRAELLASEGPDEAPNPTAIVASVQAAMDAARHPGLRRVINATGIILHTNLGRAPMAPEAADAVSAIARGYSNLEFDLQTGARGSRTQAIEPLLCALTGAEAAMAVNNCAAAMLLALSGLASGGEVVVSRGELVEIGGGFRIPDVIRQGGARLVEVGTTNKTRIADYSGAITPHTRVLLKVHQSNFRMVGFTEQVGLEELAALARLRGLLLVDDHGSGLLTDLRRLGRPEETTVQQSLAAGSDVVAFSADKLLGGPQAGLLAGRLAAIDGLRRHPLARALRIDKLSLAALEATLRVFQARGPEALPVLRAMGQDVVTLRGRAEQLVAGLGGFASLKTTIGFAGGGSLPGEGIASIGVVLDVADPSPDQLAARLRQHQPAIVGRIADGRLLLDMLAVDEAEIPDLAAGVRAAIRRFGCGDRI